MSDEELEIAANASAAQEKYGDEVTNAEMFRKGAKWAEAKAAHELANRQHTIELQKHLLTKLEQKLFKAEENATYWRHRLVSAEENAEKWHKRATATEESE